MAARVASRHGSRVATFRNRERGRDSQTVRQYYLLVIKYEYNYNVLHHDL